MRRILACLAGLCVAIAILGAAFSIWHIATSAPAYQQTRWFNKLRQLQIALQAYASDAKMAGTTSNLPASLEELVEKNYLTKAELEHLVYDPVIRYSPSQEPGAVLLTCEPPRYQATASLDGDIIVRKK
jgi:hypothetical protein